MELLFTPCPIMDYQEAISFENLYKGLKKSTKGVMWKRSVTVYRTNGLKNTYNLRQYLLEDNYKIDNYQRFMIHEPKEREIIATRIKDRQFQRSLCDNILYPQITKSFIRDNCACQKGKGVDDALNRMDVHLHRYFRKHGSEGYVLKCDIHHYFAETTHEVAKAAVAKRVKDEDAKRRVFEIIDSFGEKGIGLGSQVSQLVELAVLDDFDHWVKEVLRVKHYIRYMDDFILIHESKAFLKECLDRIREKLKEIDLELNPKTGIHPLKQGVKFLKWRFVLTASGKVIRKMCRESVVREQRKLKKLYKMVLRGERTLTQLENSFQSWVANAQRGNSWHVIRNMERYLKGVLNYGNCKISGTAHR